MSGNPTWRVVLTPQQRWILSLMLFQDVEPKDDQGRPSRPKPGETAPDRRKVDRAMYRARRALGLLEPSEAFQIHNPVLSPGMAVKYGPGATDGKSRHVFTVTEADAEFVLSFRQKVPVSPFDLIWLEPVFQQLEDGEDDPRAEALPAYDPAEDVTRWKPLEQLGEPAPEAPQEPATAKA